MSKNGGYNFIIYEINRYKKKNLKGVFFNFEQNHFVMGAPELRQSLHRIIDHADERFLRMVNSLANEYIKEDEIVAYRCGKSITKAELYHQLKEAEKEIEIGDCLAIEDFAEDSEKWN